MSVLGIASPAWPNRFEVNVWMCGPQIALRKSELPGIVRGTKDTRRYFTIALPGPALCGSKNILLLDNPGCHISYPEYLAVAWYQHGGR